MRRIKLILIAVLVSNLLNPLQQQAVRLDGLVVVFPS